ncbi:MAG: hypothetical protein KAJ29_06565 [Alphaproteobacteria bacterium]|nr:hypothetical protein [Alphaproteobacteria bacterium]
MKRLQRTFIMLLLISFPSLILSGCGVKPESVESPAGVQNDTFPSTYPDISTDPVP